MLGQIVNLMLPRFIAKKPIIKCETYDKYGFVTTLHQYCICPGCNYILNAGPNYQPNYCSECGQHIDWSKVSWVEDVQLGFAVGYAGKEKNCE